MGAVLVLERSSDLTELGRVIARARRRLHLSQEELAQRTNISQSHISLIEKGGRRASPEMLRLLAGHLDLDYTVDLAPLAGYADVLTFDDDWDRVPPQKRPPLQRIGEILSTAELNSFERFLADLFLHRLERGDHLPEQEGADDGPDERVEPRADD